MPDANNRWLWFLQTDNRQEEREINQAIFGQGGQEGGSAQPEPAAASVEPASVERAASAVS